MIISMSLHASAYILTLFQNRLHVRYLHILILSVSSLFYFCVPVPHAEEPVLPLLAFYINNESDCLYAGFDSSQADSGVLACIPRSGGTGCSEKLFFNNQAKIDEYTEFFDQQSLIHNECVLPAAAASARFTNLNLPASYLLSRAGGTTGPHIDGAFDRKTVLSCSDLGLNDPLYHGANRLATGNEASVLLSKAGLLGLEDPDGNCTNLQLIDETSKNIISGYHSGEISPISRCSFGEPGSLQPKCHDNIDTSIFSLSGL